MAAQKRRAYESRMRRFWKDREGRRESRSRILDDEGYWLFDEDGTKVLICTREDYDEGVVRGAMMNLEGYLTIERWMAELEVDKETRAQAKALALLRL